MDSQTCILGFLILTNLSIFVFGGDDMHWCYNTRNYTNNSTYHSNLKSLLSSLPPRMADSGFYNASLGQNPDQVYAIALCRVDTQLNACHACVHTATAKLLKLCPTQKQAILWLEFCMLRYSNEYFFGNMSSSESYAWAYEDYNVTSPDQFNEDLSTLLGNLTVEAASGGSSMKVAAGKKKGPDFMTIYGLLQCTPDISEQDCTNCLMACTQLIPTSCCLNSRGVYIFVPSCNVYYDVVPFYNITRIHEAQQMSSSAAFAAAPAPAPASVLQVPSPGKEDNNNTTRIVVIVIPIILSVMLMSCLCIWLTHRVRKKPGETLATDNEISTAEPMKYEFNHIREATNNFSDVNKLGEGGFGSVYKGKLQNGQEIAVKRLCKGSTQGDLEFRNEVILLAKLQHRNLVRLVGFAQEGLERVLIYEFIQNTSLDHFIFDPTKAHYIDWNRRFQIIVGIAKGLLYLHEDSRLRVIHRDLKPSNVLLDADMNPKIADFGLARLFENGESTVNTNRIIGTHGYMSPESALQGQFSIKSDVFSFGVLVLEIISGQKNINFQNRDNPAEGLLTFAWRNWHEGTITNVIDPITRSTASFHEVRRCVHIALLCIQENAIDRPTTASVVLMLSSSSVTLPRPLKPALSTSDSLGSNPLMLHGVNPIDLQSSTSLNVRFAIPSSQNDISTSVLYPR